MPFELKNTCTTYKRTRIVIFLDMIYIDIHALPTREREYFSQPIDSQGSCLGKPLKLYVVAMEESVSVNLHRGKKKKEVVYCLSRTLIEYEKNYSRVGKDCLGLILATQKLCHYFLLHTLAYIADGSYLLSVREYVPIE